MGGAVDDAKRPRHDRARVLTPLLTTLLNAGALSPPDCQRVTERAQRLGHPPVEAILELGLVGEAQLVSLLHSKLLIPEVDAKLLAHLDPDTVHLVPGSLAWDQWVLPVSMDDAGNLTVAMADPTDVTAVDAVADQTQAYVIRAVAPFSALRDSLHRYHGPRPAGRRFTPASLSDASPLPLAVPTAVGLTAPAVHQVSPFSRAAVAALIAQQATATDGDQILANLADFLAVGFGRVIVFVHRQQRLRGHLARGADLLPEAVAQVRIPTDAPSVFATVIGRRAAHLGPWPQADALDRALASALGGIGGTALVLPILVGDRVPAVFFACDPQAQLEPQLLPEIVEHTKAALSRVIVRTRRAP